MFRQNHQTVRYRDKGERLGGLIRPWFELVCDSGCLLRVVRRDLHSGLMVYCHVSFSFP